MLLWWIEKDPVGRVRGSVFKTHRRDAVVTREGQTLRIKTMTINVRDLRFLGMLPGNPVTPPEGATAVNAVLSLNMAPDSPGFEGQVQTYLEQLGNGARGVTHLAPVGQAVAAIEVAAALEMLGGIPQLAIVNFADKRVSWLDANAYRHQTVRSRRSEISHGEAFAGYTVLDGAGRGLTALQLTELAAKIGVPETDIRVISVSMGQVDLSSAESATAGMTDKLLTTGLTVEDWTGNRVLFLPGGAGIVSLIQALTIHGLSEAWPTVIRLAQDVGKVYHVAEIVHAQNMRQWAVGLAGHLDSMKPTVTLAGNVTDDARGRFEALARELVVDFRG